MNKEQADKIIQDYLIANGETEEWTLGRALGRQLGWRTLADVIRDVAYVDGAVSRQDGDKTFWSYDYHQTRACRELVERQ